MPTETPDGSRSPVEPGTWTIDAAHTTVGFSVRHMTIARVTGRFGVISGEVVVPSDDPSGATVTAAVHVASISSGHPKRDDLIRSEEFLNAEAYPLMEFASGTAEQAPDGRWRLAGVLTIKGTSRPVVLDTEFGGVITHRGATRAGFTATTVINRKDFGVTWAGALDTGGAIVSDTVHIGLEVELVLAEAAG